eukprot:6840468-Alexandrium_andersonii.AAC.1
MAVRVENDSQGLQRLHRPLCAGVRHFGGPKGCAGHSADSEGVQGDEGAHGRGVQRRESVFGGYHGGVEGRRRRIGEAEGRQGACHGGP